MGKIESYSCRKIRFLPLVIDNEVPSTVFRYTQHEHQIFTLFSELMMLPLLLFHTDFKGEVYFVCVD